MCDHIECDHIEYAMLANVTASQTDMNTNFDRFKDELSNILNKIIDHQNKIIDEQNIIKQELFILRNQKQED